jgi:hypothetical protein
MGGDGDALLPRRPRRSDPVTRSLRVVLLVDELGDLAELLFAEHSVDVDVIVGLLRLRCGPTPAGGSPDRGLLDRWLGVSGLWFEEPANPHDWAPLGSRITNQFVEVCITVAKFLHADGDIAALFGAPTPGS